MRMRAYATREEIVPVWIDPDTGEVVAEGLEPPAGGEHLVSLWPDEVADPPEARRGDPLPDWLADWYSRRFAELEGARAALDAAYHRSSRQIKAEMKSLEYRWGPQFRSEIERLIRDQSGAKKSVNLGYGPAGFRTVNWIEVLDEPAAIAWAREHARPAVKVRVEVSLRKSSLPKGEAVPGVALRTREQFYPTVK